YKTKRRTKAQIAREAGLEPLADGLLADPTLAPESFAAGFVDADKGFADAKAALDGARAILMERWGEDAALVGGLREWLHEVGRIRARVAEGKENEGAKYRDYFDHAEPLAKIPSHRLLALFRARREEILFLDLEPGADAEAGHLQAAGRQMADGRLPAGVEGQAAPAPDARPVRTGPGKGRGRGDRGVRRQPQGPATGRTGRSACGTRAGPGPAHRRQGRRGGPHRQA